MKERVKRRAEQVHEGVRGGVVIGRVSFDETRFQYGNSMGIQGKTRLVREETRVSQGERLFHRVAVSWIPAGETTMMNRQRTVLVSVTAVAVAMMVLGSNAQAQSVPTASPKNYVSFLRGLPEAKTGMSLMQRFTSLERTMNVLKHIPLPGPRIVRQMSSVHNQEMSVFSNIQKNINALLARWSVLQGRYQALENQKERCCAQGKVSLARRVAAQQGQVFNQLNGVQGLVSAERGVATPVR